MKFLRITNADGKVWLIPTKHTRLGLSLYQPSSRNGILLKKYLPYLSWLKKLKRKIGIEDVEYSINTDILNVIEKVFQEQNLEYSIFEGTPCVHKKTTIQIFKNKKILGYCKVSQNPKLYEIFRHEQELLEWLNKKGVLQIPTCLFCGEIGNDFVFLQTTVKTIKSHVRHELGYKQLDFLEMLTEKTYQKMLYHDTNQYQTVCILQKNLGLLKKHQQRIIKEAIEFIEKYYADIPHLFSACHADFTPWNMFEEAGKIFVFDFEYGSYSYMPYLDIFHFMTQTSVFEQHLSPSEIFEKFLGEETFLRKYFENPPMAYLIYLVDIIARFVVREGKHRTKDVDKLISVWFDLVKLILRQSNTRLNT